MGVEAGQGPIQRTPGRGGGPGERSGRGGGRGEGCRGWVGALALGLRLSSGPFHIAAVLPGPKLGKPFLTLSTSVDSLGDVLAAPESAMCGWIGVILLSLSLYTCGSNHLSSQAGWNRCNLSDLYILLWVQGSRPGSTCISPVWLERCKLSLSLYIRGLRLGTDVILT